MKVYLCKWYGLLVWLGTLHFTSKWSLIHLDLRPDLSRLLLLLLSKSLSLEGSWCLDLWLNSALSFSRSRERLFFRRSPRSLSLRRRVDGERERDRPMICCFPTSKFYFQLRKFCKRFTFNKQVLLLKNAWKTSFL